MNGYPSVDVQKKYVKEQMQKSIEENSLWYILSSTWWHNWIDFVGYNCEESSENQYADDPGKINNEDIINGQQLKMNLLCDKDIVIVPDTVWNYLVKIYGLWNSDFNIYIFERKAIKLQNGKSDVDLYPPSYEFKNYDTGSLIAKLNFTKAHTIGQMKAAMAKELKCNPQDVSLLTNSSEALEDTDATISEASLEREKIIFVKIVKLSESKISTRINDNYSNKGKGICGLSNLGNTCFMNSAIQCMSNVPQLTEYFLNGNKWEKELNRENPLGRDGRIAIAYAEVIKNMWSGNHSALSPRYLKTEIAKFAPQFSGYAQHDSQELMMFVLDGLHEGLNRIVKKPYIETKDADGRPDEIVANESWANHKARNDSIIVDLFHGLLKSTVICPSCNYVSVTFDPYASLSLPLQSPLEHRVFVNVWPFSPSEKCGGSFERYHLRIRDSLSAENVSRYLEKFRPLKKGLMYHVYEKDLISYHADYNIINVVVHELPEGGSPVRVIFYDKNKQPASKIYGFISIPKNKNNATGHAYTIASLRAHIDTRLDAMNLLDPCSRQRHQYDEKHSDEEDASATGDSIKNNNDATDGTTEALYSIEYKEGSSSTFLSFPTSRSNLPCLVTVSVLDDNLRDRVVKTLSINNYVHMNDQMQITRSTSGTPMIDLEQCFQLFTEKETLTGHNLWYCSKCKDHQPATKKFDLWTLPKVLVVHLKRFKSEYRHYDKNNTHVAFPLTDLDLSKFVVNSNDSSRECKYDLHAVSNHMGYIGGGHYTAYAKNYLADKWYSFDDSHTSPTKTDHIVSNSAYVLIYIRQDAQNLNNNGCSNIESAEEMRMQVD